jgi:hypothetical protein
MSANAARFDGEALRSRFTGAYHVYPSGFFYARPDRCAQRSPNFDH